MGWLKNLFSSRVSATPAVMLAKGRGFTTDIVGEAAYQQHLERIAGGKTEDGCRVNATAEIFVDRKNRADPNAVGVRICGKTVGHFPRHVAADIANQVERMWPEGQTVSCRAKVIGGWKRGTDEGNFGVKLNIAIPLRAEL